jgi:hypothetical protein
MPNEWRVTAATRHSFVEAGDGAGGFQPRGRRFFELYFSDDPGLPDLGCGQKEFV